MMRQEEEKGTWNMEQTWNRMENGKGEDEKKEKKGLASRMKKKNGN